MRVSDYASDVEECLFYSRASINLFLNNYHFLNETLLNIISQQTDRSVFVQYLHVNQLRVGRSTGVG